MLSLICMLTAQPERAVSIAREGRQEAAERGIEVLVGYLLATEARAWIAAGDYAAARRPAAEAVEVAMAVVNAEPLRESAQRVLLEAHALERNWVEVRRSYLCYRDLVRRELGVEPAHDLTRFVQATRGAPARVRAPRSAPLARLSQTG